MLDIQVPQMKVGIHTNSSIHLVTIRERESGSFIHLHVLFEILSIGSLRGFKRCLTEVQIL